ncbi:fluoride efflux transporter FluC [Nocardioides aequoreus]|uniref:fluoride efflux transporter FluC n=1 Tax=Nocardioides aequoreus TaxID=397278 RepID=UPI0009FD4197|nr:CrcB family protein [Nocardioides aequoreus]
MSALPLRWGLLAAAAGGALGTLARGALAEALPPSATGGFPWTVLVVNVTGSVLLASLALLAAARARPWLAVFLGTGVCGGFTTMSTASVDTVRLLHDGRLLAGAAYAGGTLAGALLGVWLLLRLAGRRQRRVADEGGDL